MNSLKNFLTSLRNDFITRPSIISHITNKPSCPAEHNKRSLVGWHSSTKTVFSCFWNQIFRHFKINKLFSITLSSLSSVPWLGSQIFIRPFSYAVATCRSVHDHETIVTGITLLVAVVIWLFPSLLL